MAHPGRKPPLVDLPYHHNLDLEQLFDTCCAWINAVEESLQSTANRPVLSRRLNSVAETVQAASTEFCAVDRIPHNTSYLLALILQNVYEVLKHEIDSKDSQISGVSADSGGENSNVQKIIPHGQVHLSIEKLVENLHVSEDEAQRVQEYIFRVQRRIIRNTRYTSPLEKMVAATEMWTDQLTALSIYTFPRYSPKLPDSVLFALGNIKSLLDMRELRSESPIHNEEQTIVRKSEQFLWQDLHSGGDGFGKVYKILAKDSVTPEKEFYACKVIKQSFYSEVAAEKVAILAINDGHHPNIIHVIDTWTEQVGDTQICYIQMELCEGDLQHYLQQRYPKHPLSVSEVWNIFRQLMEGIKYIHSRGMVHRDIKPKNILYITGKSGALTWKITDFGFSSVMRVPIPKPLSFGRMTRNYFAPELIISSRYNSKVDIWSAGCILYELATGKQAFATDEAVREFAWSGKDLPSVSLVRHDLGREVGEMVGRMLNVSPEMRPLAASVLRDIPNL